MTASHHELDLESLEQLTRGTHAMGKNIVADCTRVNGSVVLSTCNRFEVYLDVDLTSDVPPSLDRGPVSEDPPAHGLHGLSAPTQPYIAHAIEEISAMIANASQVDAVRADGAFTVRCGVDVVEHLFAVASGLDSLVVGEREIAGQVRRALQQAHEEQITTGALERLFQRALHTSKRVASQTQLAADGRSVVSVALDLAQSALPPWGSASALVVGTGAYAGATVAALRARGVREISVYSGSGRANEFAASHGVTPSENLVDGVSGADVIVCCSGTGRPLEAVVDRDDAVLRSTVSYVVNAAAVVAARDARAQAFGQSEMGDRPQVVVDLALHRDADPQIADVESVRLIDLNTVRANVPDADAQSVVHARDVMRRAVDDFARYERARAADAVVAELVAWFASDRDVIIARLVADGVGESAARMRAHKEVNLRVHQALTQFKNMIFSGVSPVEAAKKVREVF